LVVTSFERFKHPWDSVARSSPFNADKGRPEGLHLRDEPLKPVEITITNDIADI
jgi:hypothetical protein